MLTYTLKALFKPFLFFLALPLNPSTAKPLPSNKEHKMIMRVLKLLLNIYLLKFYIFVKTLHTKWDPMLKSNVHEDHFKAAKILSEFPALSKYL